MRAVRRKINRQNVQIESSVDEPIYCLRGETIKQQHVLLGFRALSLNNCGKKFQIFQTSLLVCPCFFIESIRNALRIKLSQNFRIHTALSAKKNKRRYNVLT